MVHSRSSCLPPGTRHLASSFGNAPNKPAQDQAAHLTALSHFSATPAAVRTPPHMRPSPCHGASGHGAYRDRSETAGTSSSQPLPENVEELGSGSLVEPQYTRTVDVRIQYDLTVDLADPEIAESSNAVNLAGGGDGAVIGSHNVFDL